VCNLISNLTFNLKGGTPSLGVERGKGMGERGGGMGVEEGTTSGPLIG
jgi:hypothetical protein